ncbi:GyrI-like domain-containing protein [Gluconobacter japonicus]|uniref:AraC family transcriptional regulator n=1 Tax=Gluconobacter japonicus TaxID=376620 RepID=UPI002E190C30
MRRLVPRSSETFNIFCCDPRTTNPNDYRLDLCVGTERVFEAGNEDIVSSIIPGGRCAVLRVVGHTDDLETAAFYLYRDFPLYCQRIAFFPEVPEHEAVADLFLPLK